MLKTKVIYACYACGTEHSRWQGQCSQCKQWNSLASVNSADSRNRADTRVTIGQALHTANTKAHLLSGVDMPELQPIATFSTELDRTLGGGLTPGSVILLGGQPGAGKSTLLLQMLCQLSDQYKVLYITGEESAQQVALRAQRLKLPTEKVHIFVNTYIDTILNEIERIKPQIIVVDSIQVMYHPEVNSSAGSISQVKECTTALTQLAKARQCIMLLVGHVTKEGALAGPKVLEHIVDTSLLLETNNDQRYRTLRAVKNRYGAVNELSVFAMNSKGMKAVSNPSAIFLSQNQQDISGRAVTVLWEGTRPLLLEIQALVDKSYLSNPKRVTVGFDYNRLSMLLAVLHRHGDLQLGGYDIFANLVGGIKISETGADLSLLLAIVSSYKDKPIDSDLVVFGEVGLSGEIRPVPYGQERLAEAGKHGFKQAIIPEANKPSKPLRGMKVCAINKLHEAINPEGNFY